MKKLNAALNPSHGKWKGYTLSELRFQRALTLVRMDIVADRLRSQTQRFDNQLNSIMSGNIFLRLFSNINFAEYAVVAVRTIRTVVRFWKNIHTPKI